MVLDLDEQLTEADLFFVEMKNIELSTDIKICSV